MKYNLNEIMLISFCVPVYNDEKYLRSCIDSILSQTVTDFELLLIDDGSNDQSPLICDEYSSKYKNVRTLHQKNSGMNVSRNKCIQEASGEWIVFVDHDDLISPYTVEVLDSIINKDQYPVIFYKSKDFEDGEKMEFIKPRTVKKKETDGKTIQALNIYPFYGELENGYRISTPWAKYYRTDYLRNNNLRFNPEIVWVEDVCFNIEAYNYLTNGLFIDCVLHGYRGNPQAFGRRYSGNLHNVIFDVLKIFKTQIDSFVPQKEETLIKKRIANRLLLIIQKVLYCDLCHIDNKHEYSANKKEFNKILSDTYIRDNLSLLNKTDVEPYLKKMLVWIRHNNFFMINFYIKTKQFVKSIIN